MNLAVVEKGSRTCPTIFPKHTVLQAMGPTAQICWMVIKAATLLFWQILQLSLLPFASEEGGEQFGPFTWAHPRSWTCPRKPRSSGTVPICYHSQALQDKFQICVVSLHCPWVLPYHPFHIHSKLFPKWTPNQDIHLYTVGFMQTALALRFCEMDSFITERDGDDTTTLYLRRMPHSCLMR